jgi:putative ABC transport system permease protein
MLSDLRYASRTLVRSPGFSLSAILAIALGIGANAAVFSVVQAVLLKPLPYARPDRLVRIWETNPAQGVERGEVGPGTYVAWRDRAKTLARVSLYMAPRQRLILGGGESHVILNTAVSPSLFETLGIQPILGRGFPAENPAAPVRDAPLMVLGYELWHQRFGGRSDILGQIVTLDGRSFMTVVGVMPRGFDFPGGSQSWTQERFDSPVSPRQRLFRYFEAVARLDDRSAIADARAELATIAGALATEFPGSNSGYSVRVESLTDAVVGRSKPALFALLAVVGCVLLIACANVANLLLARISSRRQEIAVRIALGAGTIRLLRQRLAETLVLVAIGGVMGLVLGHWGTRLLVALAPPDVPRLDEVGFDRAVLIFTATLTILTALGTSVLPMLHARRLGLIETLKASARGASDAPRSRRWIVAGQVALTLMLLVGSLLLLRSFMALRQVDLGFDSSRVLTSTVQFPTSKFFDPVKRRPWFALQLQFERLLESVAALPGVEAAGGITNMPLTGDPTAGTFWMYTGTQARPAATAQYRTTINVATPEYFTAMRIPIVRGRSFSGSDRVAEEVLTSPLEAAQRPPGVVLVNHAMAARFWPGQDPIGKAIKILDHWAVSSSVVVGIVGDVRSSEIAAPGAPALYVPWGELPGFRLTLAVRARGGLDTVAGAIPARLRATDSDVVVSSVRPMDEVISGAISRPRFNLVLISSFALLGLALAVVGIYGVVNYLVIQRTREIGIRMALGARRPDVLQMVLREGMLPVLLGIAAGLLLSSASVRVIRTLLFEVKPWDPVSFVTASLALLGVALAAAWLPARRATRVDPLVALRDE